MSKIKPITSKLTCPHCGEGCLQFVTTLRVVVDQNDYGFFMIDSEITNEIQNNNPFLFQLKQKEDGLIQVDLNDKSDPNIYAICHSDECGGVQIKFKDLKTLEDRIIDKPW